MFKIMEVNELCGLVNAIVENNSTQQERIQTVLLQACYHTFATDYRCAGKDGTPSYDAPYLNMVLDMLQQARGVDVLAITKWISAFAPVQFDKGTGYFTISKQKVDKVSLYLINNDEEERANTFWAWASMPSFKAQVYGKTDTALYAPVLNWFELDRATRAAAKAEFSPDSIESRIESLVKACVKAGYDGSAALLSGIKAEAVSAAKIADAKLA